MLFAVSVARGLHEGKLGSVMSKKRPYVHKHTVALQLVELGIGIIQKLIFEVTREGICTLVLIF